MAGHLRVRHLTLHRLSPPSCGRPPAAAGAARLPPPRSGDLLAAGVTGAGPAGGVGAPSATPASPSPACPSPGALSMARVPCPSPANERMTAMPDSNRTVPGSKPTPSSAITTSTAPSSGLHRHLDARRPAVAPDVAHRLLDDAQHDGLDRPVEHQVVVDPHHLRGRAPVAIEAVHIGVDGKRLGRCTLRRSASSGCTAIMSWRSDSSLVAAARRAPGPTPRPRCRRPPTAPWCWPG